MSTNYITNVAIVGAGGQMGKHITSALLATNKHKLIALTREGGGSTLPEGVKACPVPSYEDEAAVAEALRSNSVQALVVTLSVRAKPGTQGHLIRAAAAAGVPFVVPNLWGLDPTQEKLAQDTMMLGMVTDPVRDAEAAGSVSRLLFVGCSFWYEFSLAGGADRFGFDFAKRTIRLLDDGSSRISVSTWPQVGRALAAALSLPVASDDKGATTLTKLTEAPGVLYVTSFLLSQRDMFASVKRVTGTTDADWEVSRVPSHESVAEAGRRLAGGDFTAFAKLLYSRAFFPTGEADISAKAHNKLLGLPEEDLDVATKEAVRMAENDEVPY